MSRRNSNRRRDFSSFLQSQRLRIPHRRQLHFEPLEDRRLLATLTVNSTLDNKIFGDGLVTLREAIIAANTNATTDLGQKASGADTIVFDPTVFSGTNVIALNFGELAITESITINGTGKQSLTIDAQQMSRIFNSGEAADSVIVLLSGLTLTGGKSTGRGGAIYANNLTATDCDILNSSASAGGGIYARTPTLTRCTIVGNTAERLFNGLQEDGAGGGVYGRFTTISNCVMADNQAYLGGGFYSAPNPSFLSQVTGSILQSNNSHHGGGAYLWNSRALFTDCTISGNNSTGGGGGIRATGSSVDDLQLVRALITGNSASGSGGGILGKSYLLNSTVSNNQAEYGGGIAGAVKSINSSITNNSATGDGGGVAVSSETITLTSTVIAGNRAGGNGGGIIYRTAGFVNLNRSTVTGNIAAGNGGGIFTDSRAALISSTVSGNHAEGILGGGGIYCKNDLSLTSCTISDNSAVSNGGGIRTSGASPTTIRHSTIAYNRSLTGSGGGLWDGDGLTTNPISIEASILAKNSAAIGNPDLRLGNVTLEVSASIIGDNSGTPLVEAQTLDAQHNLIGSSTGAGVIDPKLAPLNSNGGSPPTRALLPDSPAIDFLHALTASPIHDYPITNSLADTLGGPSLVSLGGSLSTAGYTFTANKGLTLSSANINSATYSIELSFRFDTYSPGWQKIIDFKNSTADAGLYSRGSGLDFLNRAFTAGLFAPGKLVRVLFTRDDATDLVAGYVNGVQAWSFVDSANEAVLSGPNRIITFFKDDSVTITEAASGVLDRIRIFNTALTSADARTLAVVTEIPPAFDERGTPFARAMDGNGVAGAQIDVGAYESQGIPSFTRGDYNTDGIVDLVDYTLWRNMLGTNDVPLYSGADGNGDGKITNEDYAVWKSHFGAGLTVTPPLLTRSASGLAAVAVDDAIVEMPFASGTAASKGIYDFKAIPSASPLVATGDALLLLTARRQAVEQTEAALSAFETFDAELGTNHSSALQQFKLTAELLAPPTGQ